MTASNSIINPKIVMVKVGDLKPSTYNPRTWNEETTKQLTESIQQFGLVDPLLVNGAAERKNIVIGGHFRLKVAKELFDLVQQTRGVNKGIWGSKAFAFRGLLKCGQCSADITAQDKFKTLKNGNVKRFVYYNCTRRKDPNCKEKYINENNLCILLQEFIGANYKKLKITNKLQAKVDKHYYVTKTLINHYKVELALSVPLVEYSRYVLSSGTEFEKSALADGIENHLVINKGEIRFSQSS